MIRTAVRSKMFNISAWSRRRDDRWNSKRMTFSRVNWIALGKAEAGIWDTKKGRGTICRKNRPVDGTEHDLVTKIGNLPLPSTLFFADPRFLGFPRSTCASKPSRACLHAPAYIYNNVTYTPRVRLFLLFRPVARGACLRERGWFRQPETERRVRSRQ